jgi:pyruvate dehydrogenase E1 component alpha subunit
MKKSLAQQNIEYFQVLDEQGRIDSKLDPKLSKKDLLKAYDFMVLGRAFDDKMLSLQRQGRIATFAQIKGQEASNIGVAMALSKDDWLVQSFRENGAALYMGQTMKNILFYYGGDERGNKIPEKVNLMPVSVPVGSQCLHTAGIAWGLKLQKKRGVCVGFNGDGATSQGDFHEALNYAGVFNLPAVFVCQNNQFAISIPVKGQTNSETIAQKANAYGIKGVQVDGNDLLGVYRVTKDAIENARKGKGPTFIECLTYRLGNHTTSDDASRYRKDSEVKKWQKKDPILRIKNYLKKKKFWSEKYEKSLQLKVNKAIEKSVKEYEKEPIQIVDDIFKYMYEEMTEDLRQQLSEAKQ